MPFRLAGMAAAATSMVRDFGFALGPAVIGAVSLSRAAPHAVTALASGYSTGFLIVGIAALVCAVATALFPGGRTEQEQEIAVVERDAGATVG